MGIALVVLIVINWLIYHKIFTVYYLGDMRESLTNEFIWSAIAAVVELAIFIKVGAWILGYLVPIAVIVGIIFLVCRFFKKHEEKKSANVEAERESTTPMDTESTEPICEQSSETKESYIANSADAKKKNNTDFSSSQSIANTRSDLDNYILQNFSIDEKVYAIAYYREQTGVGLKEAKEKIDALFAQEVVQSKRKTESVSTTIFCTSCGKKIERTAKFCNFCGKANKYAN